MDRLFSVQRKWCHGLTEVLRQAERHQACRDDEMRIKKLWLCLHYSPLFVFLQIVVLKEKKSMALQLLTTPNGDSHVINVTVDIEMYFIKFVPFGYSCGVV